MCVHVEDSGLGIPFKPHLQRVIVDRFPAQFAALQQETFDAVQAPVQQCASGAHVQLRDCISTCGCRDGHALMTEQQIRRFVLDSNMEVYAMKLPKQSKARR